MRITSSSSVRKLYAELGYARHMPKAYVDRVKHTVPERLYDNRFGAPPVVRWKLPPDDYIPTAKRPWESEELQKNLKRSREYHNKLLQTKFFIKRINTIRQIPDEEWTIFPGDLDKGKQGTISHVIREANAVFVDGYHRKITQPVSKENAKKLNIEEMYKWEEQPLFVDERQVQLVDPNDRLPCDAKWILNDSRTGYERISTRTGFRIPLPTQAFVTYEYMSPEDYIEVVGKDTSAKDVLEETYQPRLATFEQEIEESLGLEPRNEENPKTFWY